jgi:hypothetical protein
MKVLVHIYQNNRQPIIDILYDLTFMTASPSTGELATGEYFPRDV